MTNFDRMNRIIINIDSNISLSYLFSIQKSLDSFERCEDLNQLNWELRQKLLEDGEFYIVQTKLKGIHYLRTTLMNPYTTSNELDDLINKIKSIAKTMN